MGPLGELPRMFCCNSAISRSLLIGIGRFLVETWIEFQGGSNGALKTTLKPNKGPAFRIFRFCTSCLAQDRHFLGLRLIKTLAKWRFPGEKRAARCRKTGQTTQTARVLTQTHQARPWAKQPSRYAQAPENRLTPRRRPKTVSGPCFWPSPWRLCKPLLAPPWCALEAESACLR